MAASAAEGQPSAKARQYFSEQQIERGDARAVHARTLWLVTVVWSLVVLAILAHPRVSAAVVALASRWTGAAEGAPAWRMVSAAAFAIVITVALFLLLRMPCVWARGYFLEHAYGLSTQSAGSFFGDWLKSFAITAALYAVGLWAIVLLRAKLPVWWPLAAWVTVSGLVVFMVFLWPVLVDPLFHRFTPVTEPEVRTRVLEVARSAGIETGEVLWIDASTKTKRTNAYFTGLGATKRIVLYDTLKGKGEEEATIPPDALDELETILAHEAGHWQHGHMWKGTVLAVAIIGAFFFAMWLALRLNSAWIPDAGLPAGARLAPLILLAAMLTQVLSMPLANGVSRSWERQADRASLELSGKPEAFIRAEVELARRNVAQVEPGALAVFWLYTHPPVLERIAVGEKHLERMRGSSGP
jgi:STE24 endopeptidase